MCDFFHGKLGCMEFQVDLLVKGQGTYQTLFDVIENTPVIPTGYVGTGMDNEDDPNGNNLLQLKESFSLDYENKYYAGFHINSLQLRCGNIYSKN